MSGDVSLAADVSFPDAKGYGDARRSLSFAEFEDDSKEAVVAAHGAGLIHLRNVGARGQHDRRTVSLWRYPCRN